MSKSRSNTQTIHPYPPQSKSRKMPQTTIVLISTMSVVNLNSSIRIGKLMITIEIKIETRAHLFQFKGKKSGSLPIITIAQSKMFRRKSSSVETSWKPDTANLSLVASLLMESNNCLKTKTSPRPSKQRNARLSTTIDSAGSENGATSDTTIGSWKIFLVAKRRTKSRRDKNFCKTIRKCC